MSNVTVSPSVLLYRRRRAEFIAERGNACERCGSAERLEIDHIDRDRKTLDPSVALQRRREVRLPEMALCQVLCYSCHKSKTVAEQAGPEHGTHHRYVRGCRCDECRGAHAAMARRYRSKSPL